jgi:hypothetical protein
MPLSDCVDEEVIGRVPFRDSPDSEIDAGITCAGVAERSRDGPEDRAFAPP